MEKELFALCKALINKLTDGQFELLERFVEIKKIMEQDASVVPGEPFPLPDEPIIELKKTRSKEKTVPVIEQGALPWDKTSATTKDTTRSVDPLDDLPF